MSRSLALRRTHSLQTEEDIKKKAEIDLLAERLLDPAAGVQKLALETLRHEIRTATSSMTSIPKPLKFLRPHYNKLKESFEKVTDADNKVSSDACRRGRFFHSQTPRSARVRRPAVGSRHDKLCARPARLSALQAEGQLHRHRALGSRVCPVRSPARRPPCPHSNLTLSRSALCLPRFRKSSPTAPRRSSPSTI